MVTKADFKGIKNWQIAKEIREEIMRSSFPNKSRAGTADRIKYAALVAMWGEILLLSELRCAECSGFGHNQIYCPTTKRLSKIARVTAITRNKLSCARHTMRVRNAKHRRPSSVPKKTKVVKEDSDKDSGEEVEAVANRTRLRGGLIDEDA